jgi:cobalt-zinc-cadmium efflux system outer membrane protein
MKILTFRCAATAWAAACAMSFAASQPPSQQPAGPASQPPANTSELPQSLTLEKAEELLIRRNIPVAAGQAQVEIAEAARRIAGLRPNPNLQIGAEQFPFWSNIPGSYPRFWNTNGDAGVNPTYTVQFQQTLERGGKRALRSEQAGALLESSRAQVLDTIRQQLQTLRLAFSAALLAKANLQVAEEVDRQYAETERVTETRLRSGDIALVDLERIKGARLAYRQAVLDAKSAYAQAVRDVQTVLGVTSARPDFSIEGSFGDRQVTASLEDLKSMAAAERPDLLAAQKAKSASDSGVRLAESLRRRDLSVAMEYQRVGNDSAVGAIVSFPLFLYNNQKDAIAQAIGQQRLAALQVRQTELQTAADVEKAYLALGSARQTLDLYSKDAVDRSVRVRDIVQYSYQRGEASLLELLDAQRSTNQIRAAFNQAKFAYETAYWQLVAAVGRNF